MVLGQGFGSCGWGRALVGCRVMPFDLDPASDYTPIESAFHLQLLVWAQAQRERRQAQRVDSAKATLRRAIIDEFRERQRQAEAASPPPASYPPPPSSSD
jgi:hypothetical protein